MKNTWYSTWPKTLKSVLSYYHHFKKKETETQQSLYFWKDFIRTRVSFKTELSAYLKIKNLFWLEIFHFKVIPSNAK